MTIPDLIYIFFLKNNNRKIIYKSNETNSKRKSNDQLAMKLILLTFHGINERLIGVLNARTTIAKDNVYMSIWKKTIQRVFKLKSFGPFALLHFIYIFFPQFDLKSH